MGLKSGEGYMAGHFTKIESRFLLPTGKEVQADFTLDLSTTLSPL